jgi:DNA mismatch endonuclease (patch repair protein)
MRRNPKTGTRPEERLGRVLHAAGLRYRKHWLIKTPAGDVRPDIVFTRRKVAVFVDGCFWHVCPLHGNVPIHNADYWIPKLTRNILRDRHVDLILTSEGWSVIRIWEHTPVDKGAVEVLRRMDSR